jgi:hypothetical protein
MEYTITSTRARIRAGRAGFTVAELVVAGGIGTLVVAAVLGYSVFAARSFHAMSNYVMLDMKSRYALDIISRDIRQANACSSSSFSSNSLTLLMTDPVSSLPFTISYSYDAASGTLTRTDTDPNETSTSMLLTNCLSFAFSYYQRNPVGGNWEVFPIDPSQANQCKLVQVDWTCARSSFGSLNNSESMRSAKIVIRKE